MTPAEVIAMRDKRRIIPYRLYRWVADRLVGKVLVYGVKRELERGNVHEANHLALSIQLGNSQLCDESGKCSMRGQARIFKEVTDE